MNIEFDPNKNVLNIRKHGINLADVDGVFYDQFAITLEDSDHAEQRFVTMGMDALARLLVVCYTYRDEATMRVISARKPQAHERKYYQGDAK